jgi:hypothetical protein
LEIIMTQTAKYEVRDAWCATEFGAAFAARRFPEINLDAQPKYVKGKNAGKTKVGIQWVKCTEGGWVRDRQRVDNRVGKVIAARLIIRVWGEPVPQVVALWEDDLGDIWHLLSDEERAAIR